MQFDYLNILFEQLQDVLLFQSLIFLSAFQSYQLDV